MFGRNKISQEEVESLRQRAEQDERVFAQVEEHKDMFDAGVTELEESYRQVEAGVTQVQENMKSAAALAEENAQLEATLSHSLSACKERLEESEEQQKAVLDRLRGLFEESAKLVEENKHFTSPSKYLSEYPAGARSQNQVYVQSLDQMAEYGKQMGVLALNAAIEAGRLGESGKQFVTAAEDIRSYAGQYDKSVQELKLQLVQANERTAELEEQIRHLVGLLKDNNMATAKLMKHCNEVLRFAEQSQPEAFSQEIADLKSQVTILKNADEEIIKSEERNRMQMEDLVAEFEAQQENQKELFGWMDPVFRHVVERKVEE